MNSAVHTQSLSLEFRSVLGLYFQGEKIGALEKYDADVLFFSMVRVSLLTSVLIDLGAKKKEVSRIAVPPSF